MDTPDWTVDTWKQQVLQASWSKVNPESHRAKQNSPCKLHPGGPARTNRMVAMHCGATAAVWRMRFSTQRSPQLKHVALHETFASKRSVQTHHAARMARPQSPNSDQPRKKPYPCGESVVGCLRTQRDTRHGHSNSAKITLQLCKSNPR